MANMNELLRQAQMMQRKMAEMQEQLAARTVEAASGGGMVTVVANGAQDILSVRIDKAVVNPEDVEMLQDLVLAAVQEAIKKSREMQQAEMSSVAGGLKIPGMF